MIEAQNLTRRYGDFTAVDGISFAVHEGEIVGMLGPNGAGKTTTIRMITGFLPPTGGRVTVAGKDLFDVAARGAPRSSATCRRTSRSTPRCGSTSTSPTAPGSRGCRAPRPREAIGDAVERCLLGDVRHQIIGTLSKGYRQRVGLATAILHRPARPGPRRADGRARPQADHRHPRADPRAGPRAHAAALDPHPARGRAALRPRADHRPRPHRRRGHAREPARAAGRATRSCG